MNLNLIEGNGKASPQYCGLRKDDVAILILRQKYNNVKFNLNIWR